MTTLNMVGLVKYIYYFFKYIFWTNQTSAKVHNSLVKHTDTHTQILRIFSVGGVL